MITKDDEKLIDETLEEASRMAVIRDGAYDLEIYLSTDGKHTVKGSASTPEGMKRMYEVATTIYQQILDKYGTKQAQTVKEYRAPGAETSGGDVCPVHHKPWREGKFGRFCSTKLDDGTWCKEKPKK